MASALLRRFAGALFFAGSALAVRESAVVEDTDSIGGGVFQRTWSGHYFIAFPDKYKDIFLNATHLGTGSFGESWQVTDARPGSPTSGVQVVVKLLYVESSGGGYQHLTWGLVKRSNKFWPKVEEAAVECEIAQTMETGGNQLAAMGTPHIGARRIMGCYGHNVPMTTEARAEASKDPDAPLYLVLENCGANPLTDYVNEKATDRDLMMNLFKQLLEGLDFMASLNPPWIHHDLKPDNVVVKKEADGSHTLHLIDFGATTQITNKDKCKMTASTGAYAPLDWSFRAPSCPRGVCNFRTICGDRCGTAFDIFAAGVIFMEMTWTRKTRHCAEWDNAEPGQLCYKIMADLPGAYNYRGEELNYPQLERWGKTDSLALKRLVDPGEKFNSEVFNAVAKTLRSHPANRPTAAELLALDAFKAIRTPGDTFNVSIATPESSVDRDEIEGGVQEEVDEDTSDANVIDEGHAILGAKSVIKELQLETGLHESTGPKCPKVQGKAKRGEVRPWIECNRCDEAMEKKGKRNVRKKFFHNGSAYDAVTCFVEMAAVSFGFGNDGICKDPIPHGKFYKLVCAEE